MRDSDSALLEKIGAALEEETPYPQVLDLLLAHLNCVTGTVHLLDQNSGMLQLAAQRGIPEVVLDKIKVIPIGKGMAGIAAERREPVQVCNLQTDNSGVVRPGARDTRMEGSIAAPMLNTQARDTRMEGSIAAPMLNTQGALKGTLGVAKPVAYDFTEQECDLLMQVGQMIADRL